MPLPLNKARAAVLDGLYLLSAKAMQHRSSEFSAAAISAALAREGSSYIMRSNNVAAVLLALARHGMVGMRLRQVQAAGAVRTEFVYTLRPKGLAALQQYRSDKA